MIYRYRKVPAGAGEAVLNELGKEGYEARLVADGEELEVLLR